VSLPAEGEVSRSPRLAKALAAVSILLLPAVAVGWGFWGFSHDDAFITYRYADQWARGNGLTFNTDEHVMGTSAPGYALLLGALSRVAGSLGMGAPEWGTVLSLAAILSIAWIFAAAAASASAPARLGVPLLFGLCALFCRWNIEMLGSESILILALVAGAAFLLFVRDRPILGGLALAAAMVLRLDASIAAASFGGVLWSSSRRFPLKFSIAGLAPVAPWLAGLYSRFGTVIPSTLAAKRSEYADASKAYTLAEWHWLRRSLPLAGCLVLLAAAAVGCLLLLRRGFGKHPAVVALAAWLLALEVFYRAVRVPFAPWYHEGLINALFLLAAFGVVTLGRNVLWPRKHGWLPPALVAGALLLPVLLPSASYVRGQWGRPPDPRFETYRAVGIYLSEHTPPQATILAVEVGIIGYFSRHPILDLSGLVTPEVLEAKSRGRFGRFVEASRPDYIVETPNFRGNALAFLDEPVIQASYGAAREFPLPEGGACRLLGRTVRAFR
jgi:arabinofuranosyltransferase